MLKISCFLPVCCLFFSASAQINLTVGNIKVMPGTTLYTAADLNTSAGTTLDNAGEVRVGTDLVNAGTMDNNGHYFVGRNYTTNNGTLLNNNNTFTFNGSVDGTITTGPNSISNLILQKSGTGSLILGDPLRITGGITFATALSLSNHILCNGHTLQLSPAATISGYTPSRYIITGATGLVKKQALGSTPFFFPVGFNSSSYNPVSITNNGTVDTFTVQVQEQVRANGTTGTPLTAGAVNASWVISEVLPGGSNLDITAYWSVPDHLSGFNPNDCGMAYWDGSDWELPPSLMGLATSSTGQYSRTRTGLTSFNVISVSGASLMDKVQVNLRALLQGPYTSGPHMTDLLRTKSLIPFGEPYTGHPGFTHVGRGGAETTTSTVLTDIADQNAITDWVFVELRDGTTPATVLQTRAALIQRDGDVVDTDGVSALRLPAIDGAYHIALRHRNHLGIRTANPVVLAELSTTSYDFTTSLTQAFGTTPMAALGSGVYGMFGGNANSNTSTRATGPPTLNDYTSILSELGALNFILNVYKRQDLNLDGDLRKTGPPSINDYSKLLNILGTPSNIITQPF